MASAIPLDYWPLLTPLGFISLLVSQLGKGAPKGSSLLGSPWAFRAHLGWDILLGILHRHPMGTVIPMVALGYPDQGVFPPLMVSTTQRASRRVLGPEMAGVSSETPCRLPLAFRLEVVAKRLANRLVLLGPNGPSG